MDKNNKLDEKEITNIIHKHIKPTEQIKFIIYSTKFKTSNLIVKNNTNFSKSPLNQTNVHKLTNPFRECLLEKITKETIPTIWNRTVLDFENVYLWQPEFFEIELFLWIKLCTYANPSCLK